MRWTPRPVVAVAALLALYITVPVAFGENDNEKTESPAAPSALWLLMPETRDAPETR
jgi:hypothetical protein